MFYYSLWTSLSLPTRHAIASKFNIVKRGPTHVDSNVVVSDGYDMKEVENSLSPETIQAYLETVEQDAAILWEMLVAKAEGRETPVVEIPVTKEAFETLKAIVDEPAEVPKKKGGRPKKAK